MCPIFKNIDIHGTKDIIGEHMVDYYTTNNISCKKSRKLIGSMKGDKILLYTPLLKWYLEHGLEITKFYQAITYTPNNALKVYRTTSRTQEGREMLMKIWLSLLRR